MAFSVLQGCDVLHMHYLLVRAFLRDTVPNEMTSFRVRSQ